MVQIEKFSKKKAKKVAAGARHSSEREEKQDVASMAGIPAAERHGEEFEVREPVEPPRFSIADDISLPEELTPTPEDVASDISPFADDLPEFSAEDGPSLGAKLSQIFPAAFSPTEDDISIPEDHTSTPEEETADIYSLSDDLPCAITPAGSRWRQDRC